MKFTNKLFKIQAKISLPVFILMGSVCRLDASELPLHDVSREACPACKGLGFVQVSGAFNPTAKKLSSSEGLIHSLRALGVSSRMFASGRGGRGRGGAGRGFVRQEVLQSTTGEVFPLNTVQTEVSYVQESPKTPDVQGSPKTPLCFSKIHTQDLPKGVSPGDMADLLNPSGTRQGLSNVKKTLCHKSPVTNKSSVTFTVDADEEVLSPGVRAEMQCEVAEAKSDGSAMVPHGQRLDFSDGLTEERALVSGDAVSSFFAPDSILTASSNDVITLRVGERDVETSIDAMLAKIDVGDANKGLTYLVHYAACMQLDEDDRNEYLEQLLELPDFSGQTIESALSFLQTKVFSAADLVPGFLKSLVQKDRKYSALVQRYYDESQAVAGQASLVLLQNSMLKNTNQALMQSLRHAFNDSELSKMFAADSTEILCFNTSEWSTAQFSQCLQFIVNQFIESQKTNAVLGKNNEKLADTISELSSQQKSLTQIGQTLSVTMEKIVNEKSELDLELKAMRAERENWREKELAFEQLKLENVRLKQENEHLKSYSSSVDSARK
ncbi:MAG: hypothetical protein V4482_05690 [Pseudomonadota bacterium]